jgi:hypothetical protein
MSTEALNDDDDDDDEEHNNEMNEIRLRMIQGVLIVIVFVVFFACYQNSIVPRCTTKS